MKLQRKAVVSGCVAFAVASVFLLFAELIDRWTVQARGTPLDFLALFIVMIPALGTGNGNWHAPVINMGGYAGGVFIFVFFGCFGLLSLRDLLRDRNPHNAVAQVLRAILQGIVLGACLGTAVNDVLIIGGIPLYAA